MPGSNPGEIGRIRESSGRVPDDFRGSSGRKEGEMQETGVTWRQRPNAARTVPGTPPGMRARLLGTPAETLPVQVLGFDPDFGFVGFEV